MVVDTGAPEGAVSPQVTFTPAPAAPDFGCLAELVGAWEGLTDAERAEVRRCVQVVAGVLRPAMVLHADLLVAGRL